MTKLVPEIKAEWIAALRSGEYKQRSGGLRHGDTYCCLGVLCEIAVKHGIISTKKASSLSNIYLYDGSVGAPPQSLVQWAFGTESYIPRDKYVVHTDTFGSRNLIFYNDVAGYTFNQIADLIEKDL